MIIDIIGFKSINTDKKVEVIFKGDRKGVYNPDKVEHLLLNLSDVAEIRILKDDK